MKLSEDERKELFMRVFLAAKRKYAKNTKRLAGEGWAQDWQYLIAIMMSAQTRDETTIPAAINLFRKFGSLKQIAQADSADVLESIKKVNYNVTKAKNIKATAEILLKEHNGQVPKDIDSLVLLPGVGRKTANLVLSELHKRAGICVDTHVHRISNVLGIVETKNPSQTEQELMKIVPRRYWNKINRIFVLWGQEVPGRDKDKLLSKINLKE